MKQATKQKLKEAFIMFAIFFKIGLFSFGGGYAMLSMMERELVDKRKYLTHKELADIFAIAESTPGAISINIATFVGTQRAGIFGGILTTLGMVIPSFLIILAISYIINLFRENVWVGYLFRGIRVGVLVLIAKAVFSFFRDMRKDWFDFVLLIAAFLIAFLTNISVIYIILGTILICVGVLCAKNMRRKSKGIITDFDAYEREIRSEADEPTDGEIPQQQEGEDSENTDSDTESESDDSHSVDADGFDTFADADDKSDDCNGICGMDAMSENACQAGQHTNGQEEDKL